ncbi:MAG: hypothetical protein ACYSUV_13135 [Planctomycetota bacterium]
MVLSVVGNFNREEIVSQIDVLFGSIRRGGAKIKKQRLEESGPKLKIGGPSAGHSGDLWQFSFAVLHFAPKSLPPSS